MWSQSYAGVAEAEGVAVSLARSLFRDIDIWPVLARKLSPQPAPFNTGYAVAGYCDSVVVLVKPFVAWGHFAASHESILGRRHSRP